MGTPEVPHSGRHCSADGCMLIDFLPFNCERCDQVFCLQHRSYTRHQCPVATNQIDISVLICPLCGQGVRLRPNEDPNITWDTHVNSECDPLNYQKTTKKKSCPAPGCCETLNFSNAIRCKYCTQEHCLTHRFAPDHECTGPKKPDTGYPFINLLRRSLKNDSTPIQTFNGSAKWSSNFLHAASSLMASAEAGMQKLSVATNHALQKAKDGVAQGRGSGGNLAEQCLQCQARFAHVNSLIEHVEKAHNQAVQAACTMEMIENCPKCNITFKDPVLLIKHVEKEHGDTTSLKG
ncbi:hypothetical protein HPP92_015356 [Vanilla planifolia]|uniref:AN1-type domain-containing protein n=1 Tax=Vanilla planifolia TaxID=51239 RepID=A0A835QLQ3_VANPL|nr:hypothetical protein HPP92_015356 [Vanilla planifolia]